MQLLTIFRRSPFLRLLSFYVAGLIVGRYFELPKSLIILIVVQLVILTVLILSPLKVFRRFDLNWTFGCLVFVLLFLSGIIHYSSERLKHHHVVHQFATQGIFKVIILETPEVKSETIKALVRINGLIDNDSVTSGNFKVILYFEKDSLSSTLLSGHELVINTRLNQVPLAGNPGEFNYRKYLSNRKIYLQGYVSSGSWKTISKKRGKQIKTIASDIREKLLYQYRKLQLNRTEFGALSALTLGYRNDLDAQIKNSFTRAGVMHVMALSGFHVGVVALLLGFLFGSLSWSVSAKVMRIVIMVLSLWGFAVITGLSASVTRATLMFGFVIVGKSLGRKIIIHNILFAAAFVMLLFTPGLIADVSFQLSFSAVLGIVFFYPLIYRSVKVRSSLLNRIWQMIAISCSAQLATFPFTMYYFHQFPVFFWLTNLFVIPLVAVIIFLAGGYLLLSFIKPLGLMIGKLLAWSVKLLLLSVNLTEKMPNALIENIQVSMTQVILVLLMLFTIGMFLRTAKKVLLHLALISILALLVTEIVRAASQKDQKLLVINNLKGISSLNLISGSKNMLLIDPDSMVTQQDIKYAFSEFWLERGVNKDVLIAGQNDTILSDSLEFPGLYVRQDFLGTNIFLRFYNTSLVFLKSNDFGRIVTDKGLEVDMIVVSGSVVPDIENIIRLFDLDCLVIDSSVGHFNVSRWIRACKDHSIDYWDISGFGPLYKQL